MNIVRARAIPLEESNMRTRKEGEQRSTIRLAKQLALGARCLRPPPVIGSRRAPDN